MYVDESGDMGLVNSPTRFFVLSGVVIHEMRFLQWSLRYNLNKLSLIA